MAIFKMPLVSAARGSIGDTTFANWNGIIVAKKKITYMGNPKTASQEARRELMKIISPLYFSKSDGAGGGRLSEEQKAGFESGAKKLRDGVDLGDGGSQEGGNLIPAKGKVMSGYNLCLALNGNRHQKQSGFSQWDICDPANRILTYPEGKGAPDSPTILCMEMVGEPGNYTLRVTWQAPCQIGDSAVALARLKIKTRDKMVRPQIVGYYPIDPGLFGAVMISEINCYSEHDTNRPLPPGAYVGAMDTVTIDGGASASSNEMKLQAYGEMPVPDCCDPNPVSDVTLTDDQPNEQIIAGFTLAPVNGCTYPYALVRTYRLDGGWAYPGEVILSAKLPDTTAGAKTLNIPYFKLGVPGTYKVSVSIIHLVGSGPGARECTCEPLSSEEVSITPLP